MATSGETGRFEDVDTEGIAKEEPQCRTGDSG